MKPELSLERMWAEIEAGYETAFLKELLALPGAAVYVFGGTLRDVLLGNRWKDLDMRITLPHAKEARNRMVEEVFEKHGTIVTRLSFANGENYVLRALFPGKKGIVADIQIVTGLDVSLGDFTVSSLFMDLKTGELHTQTPTGFEDLENRLIRPVAGERVFEVEPPYMALRALKLACQTGFDLEPSFRDLLTRHPHKVREHVGEEFAYLSKNGKDSFGETRLGNLFSGLKVDPKRYVSLINELGFYRPLCEGFLPIAPSPKTEVSPDAFPVEKYQANLPLETKISYFLSDIARSISRDPEACFSAMKQALALDTDRADGNEFVIDPQRVLYA